MNKLQKYIEEQRDKKKIPQNIAKEMTKLLREDKRNTDIAIVGISLRTSLANDTDSFWNNIKNGLDFRREIPEGRKRYWIDFLKYQERKENKKSEQVFNFKKSSYLDSVYDFDYEYFDYSKKDAVLIDPSQRIFLEVATEAIEDAGLERKIKGTKTGVYTSSANNEIYLSVLDKIKFFPRTHFLPEAAMSNRLSYYFNLSGPSIVVDTSCSSSLVATHLACKAIINGECEQAIVGAVSAKTSPLLFEHIFGLESDDGVTKPFDDGADGTNFGEGAVAIVIKPFKKALKDRDHIYSVIKGGAINCDGRSTHITAPNVEAQKNVVLAAWQDAMINPRRISYIETHGTATSIGDSIEVSALTKAFRKYTNKKQFCAIASLKSNIGHTMEASGLFGVIKASLSMESGKIAPSINFKKPNQNIDWQESSVYVNNKLINWKREKENKPFVCGVSSFGLTGVNAHLVLEEAPRAKKINITKSQGRYEIFTISAKSLDVLLGTIKIYYQYFIANNNFDIHDICYTKNTGHEHHKYRVSVVVSDVFELIEVLKKIKEKKPLSWKKLNLKNFCYSNNLLGENKKEEKEKNKAVLISNFNKSDLNKLSVSYVEGFDVAWDVIYKKIVAKKISLPTYQFKKNKCRVELPNLSSEKKYFYKMVWQNKKLKNKKIGDKKNIENVLILTKSNSLSKELVKSITKKEQKIVIVNIGNEFKKVNDDKYIIKNIQKDYDVLFKNIVKDKIIIHRIVHLSTIIDSKTDLPANSIKMIKKNRSLGLMSLFYLFRALEKNNFTHRIDLVLLSNNVDKVLKNDLVLRPEINTMFGLGKVLSVESLKLRCRAIDIDKKTKKELVTKEIDNGFTDYKIAYRNGKRYIEILDAVDMNKIKEKRIKIKKEGAYIIIGGAGGMGLAITKYLTKKNPQVKVVLIGRTILPRRKKWEEVIRNNFDKKLVNTLKKIIEIENRGVEIDLLSADVSDKKQIIGAIKDIKNKYGKINAVIHAAGVAGEGFVKNKSEKIFKSVLLPKIEGAWFLSKALEKEKLDFFLFFSSTASIFGGPGQGDYTAANSYLDVFSKQVKGTKVLGINWCTWRDVGMALEHKVNKNSIIKTVHSGEAVKRLFDILDKEITNQNVLIGELNTSYIVNYISNKDRPLFIKPSFGILEDLKNNKKIEQEFYRENYAKNMDLRYRVSREDGHDDMEQQLVDIWLDVLNYHNFKLDDNFFEVGGDSLKAIKMFSLINKNFGIEMEIKRLLNFNKFSDLLREVEKEIDGGNKNKKDKDDYVSPKTKTEKQVAKIWQEIFGVKRVGLSSSLSALPKNSFKTVKLLEKVNTFFGIDLELSDINKKNSLGDLSALIEDIIIENNI